MTTRIRQVPRLEGRYALEILARLDSGSGGRVECGVVRFARGTRSPVEGLHRNSCHEFAFVLSGRVLVETADRTFEAGPGDCLIGTPSEAHATTGLEDADLLFVLVDPVRAVGQS